MCTTDSKLFWKRERQTDGQTAEFHWLLPSPWQLLERVVCLSLPVHQVRKTRSRDCGGRTCGWGWPPIVGSWIGGYNGLFSCVCGKRVIKAVCVPSNAEFREAKQILVTGETWVESESTWWLTQSLILTSPSLPTLWQNGHVLNRTNTVPFTQFVLVLGLLSPQRKVSHKH